MPDETSLRSKGLNLKIKTFSFQRTLIILFGLSFAVLFLLEGPLKDALFPSESIEYFIPSGLLIDDAWYEILFGENTIGYLHLFTKAKKKGGYIIKSETSTDIPILGKIENFDLETTMDLTKDYSLEYARIELNSSKYFLKGTLRKEKNSRFRISIKTPSQNTNQYIETRGKLINSSFMPMITNYMPLRRKVKLVFFDPFLNKNSTVSILKKGRKHIQINGKNISVLEFAIDTEGIKAQVYTDLKGRILEQSLLGFKFIKTDPAQLFKKKFNRDSFDLIRNFTITVKNIPNKDKLKRLKVKIKGIDINSIPNTFSQSVDKNDSTIEIFKRVPKNTLSTPIDTKEFAKYLKEEKSITFNSNTVGETAAKIIGKERNAFRIIKLLTHWIDKNIEKAPTISIPDSLSTLNLKQGDCGELSALLVGFLRSVGIPSYVSIGLVYEDSMFFYHAWVSAFIGEWINVDPALGQNIADATHITLTKRLKNQIEIVKFIGSIKIDIVDYSY